MLQASKSIVGETNTNISNDNLDEKSLHKEAGTPVTDYYLLLVYLLLCVSSFHPNFRQKCLCLSPLQYF